jgi:hypothetical protein
LSDFDVICSTGHLDAAVLFKIPPILVILSTRIKVKLEDMRAVQMNRLLDAVTRIESFARYSVMHERLTEHTDLPA